MKTQIVSFSGGRTSAFLVYLMEQKRINEGWPVEYVFFDTGAEHPKTYEFIKNVVKHWEIDLICLQAVINPEHGKGIRAKRVPIESMSFDLSLMQKLVNKYGNFTINRPMCTTRMKTDVLNAYCREHFSKDSFENWIGIRADEPRRLPKPQNIDLIDGMPKPRWHGNFKINYLASISDFTKQDILDWWKQQPFDLEIPEHLGNCVFCIKKGVNKTALAARDEPELWEEWRKAMTDMNNVRLMPADKFGIGHIYRGWLSPDQVIAMFEEVTTEDLRQHIYKSKQLDSNPCSESCEVFSGQMELEL